MKKVKVWVLSFAGYIQLNHKNVPYMYKTRAKAIAAKSDDVKVHKAVLVVGTIAK